MNPRPDLSRRELLRTSAGAFAAAAFAPRWLARAAACTPPSERVLIVLELRGGNDGLNTVVPVEDARYYALRPSLALPAKDLVAIDELNRMNPALSRLAARYAEGRVAIVQNVGYPEPNLSHFESQDIWQSASQDSVRREVGWLGAWRDASGAAVSSDLSMIAVGSEVLPLSLRSRGALAPAVQSLESFRFRGSSTRDGRETADGAARLVALEALHRAPSDDAELAFVEKAVETTARASRELATASTYQPRGTYPSNALGRDLRAIASILGAGLPTRVFHVVHDGFDTHTDQLRSQKALLESLDVAIDGLITDLRALGRFESTAILTTSEFGRRPADSGGGRDAGTDHGAASVLFVVGGAVKGGVLGGQPDLGALDANGNVRASIDFRRVYASAIGPWLGGDPAALLGQGFEPLELFAT